MDLYNQNQSSERMWFFVLQLWFLSSVCMERGFLERAERKIYLDHFIFKVFNIDYVLLLNAQKNTTRQQGII